jgi:hypothetical protein
VKGLVVGIVVVLVLPVGLVLLGAAVVVSTFSGGAVQAVCTVADSTDASAIVLPDGDPAGEGGIGFALPAPGTPRLASLTTPAASIPADIQALYVAAADRYHLPWTLLAGIGMEESVHGRVRATSSAGAQGLMQFIPATWVRYGVDGSGDGRADILDDADSVTSAANYLTASGVTAGIEGVRTALFAYNHADWYVNDVLYYVAAYGGGVVAGDPSDCGLGVGGVGNPAMPALPSQQIATVLAFAVAQLGEPYVYGASGPDAWDCSGFTRAAFAQIGVVLPRTAAAQQSWVAAGNGFEVPLGQERPGDLIFTDSYLGPNRVGHVMIVFDPTRRLTIEAGGSHVGHYDYGYWTGHHLFSIWRVGAAA